MKLAYVTNRDQKKADFLLYGIIGQDVDGHVFAQEIEYISKEVDVINVRINSEGGKVFQGLSIFLALYHSEAHINIIIDGVAASMASIIAMAGDTIQMNDFARLMSHDPAPGNNSKLDRKTVKMLKVVKSMLIQIYTRRGISPEEMSSLMKAETWFSPEEALTKGLIDEVIDTGRKIEVNNELSEVEDLSEIAACLSKFINPNKKIEKMIEIINTLELDEKADSSEIVNAINSIRDENKALKEKNETLEGTIETLENTAKETVKANTLKTVENLISKGLVDEKKKDELVKLGTDSPEAFNTVVNSLKSENDEISLKDILNEIKTGEKKTEDKTFDWYRENDPEALAEMETANPEAFNKLYEAYSNEN